MKDGVTLYRRLSLAGRKPRFSHDYVHYLIFWDQFPVCFCHKPIAMLFNPYRAGTELTRFNYVNIMAAGALAPYVARTSAAMILIM